MRIRDALQDAASVGVDRLDAQLLLGHLLHQPRSWLLAHDDHTLGPALAAEHQADLLAELAEQN